MKGVVYDRILGCRDYVHVSTSTHDVVDCTYVITLGTSPHLSGVVSRARRFSRRVMVLHSLPITTDVVDGVKEEHSITFLHFGRELHEQVFRYGSSHNPTGSWSARFDIPSKRNFAINHARHSGFGVIMLIDDDVIFRNSFVSSAIHVLNGGADIACGYSLFHADVSTLDRIRSVVHGTRPEVSISGNAMVLRVGPRLSFFPYVYNEDWLFFWSSIKYGGATIVPFQDVVQRRPRKGRELQIQMEQFGELLAYSMFDWNGGGSDLSLLQQEDSASSAVKEYCGRVAALLESPEHHHLVASALVAINGIVPADICSFAKNFERDLREHYGVDA